MALPTMPGTHRWFRGGPALKRVANSPQGGGIALFASDSDVVWVWDEETGDRVADLLDENANPIDAPAISGGWIAGVGLPVATEIASYSVGQFGKRYELLPVVAIKNAIAALAPTAAQIATVYNDAGSDFRIDLDADLNSTFDPLLVGGKGTVRKGDIVLNVKDSGATGNGTTNDTAAIQSAIDTVTAAGGGVVYFPRGDYLVTSLTLKQGVSLIGMARNHGYAGGGGNFTVRIKSATAGATVIDTPVGTIYTPAVQGITIDGGAVASIGIRLRAPQWATLRDLHILNATDQGLKIDGGNACRIADLLVMNCLLTRPRAAVSGVVEIAGADHWIERVEASGSLTALTDSNRYVRGILLTATNCFLSGVVGEVADGGIAVTGNYNRFSNCRADLNWGHGWEISGNLNAFSSCMGVANGRQTAGTYTNIRVTGQTNSFAACRSVHASGATVKYGIEDTVVAAPVNLRNTYDAGCGGDGVTAPFFTGTYVGSGKEMPPHDLHPAAGTTSIDITGTSLVVFDNYSSATTVTAFTGGVPGQSLTLIGDPDVTIANGTSIRTSTGANKTLAANRAYTFRLYNGAWYEVAP